MADIIPPSPPEEPKPRILDADKELYRSKIASLKTILNGKNIEKTPEHSLGQIEYLKDVLSKFSFTEVRDLHDGKGNLVPEKADTIQWHSLGFIRNLDKTIMDGDRTQWATETRRIMNEAYVSRRKAVFDTLKEIDPVLAEQFGSIFFLNKDGHFIPLAAAGGEDGSFNAVALDSFLNTMETRIVAMERESNVHGNIIREVQSLGGMNGWFNDMGIPGIRLMQIRIGGKNQNLNRWMGDALEVLNKSDTTAKTRKERLEQFIIALERAVDPEAVSDKPGDEKVSPGKSGAIRRNIKWVADGLQKNARKIVYGAITSLGAWTLTDVALPETKLHSPASWVGIVDNANKDLKSKKPEELNELRRFVLEDIAKTHKEIAEEQEPIRREHLKGLLKKKEQYRMKLEEYILRKNGTIEQVIIAPAATISTPSPVEPKSAETISASQILDIEGNYSAQRIGSNKIIITSKDPKKAATDFLLRGETAGSNREAKDLAVTLEKAGTFSITMSDEIANHTNGISIYIIPKLPNNNWDTREHPVRVFAHQK